jgi:cobalt-zinc-cadmium efflux system outer membrane protein
MIRKIFFSSLFLCLTGCTIENAYDRDYVSQGIQDRTDYPLGQVAQPGEFILPEGVSLEDGLTPDEAVALALWNNAQFQADLATLGFARADLVRANMLPNPVFSILFPVGPRQLEANLKQPIDALWQRPHRIAMAEYEAESLSENLIRNGLGLIRDVWTTYADLLLAQQKVRLAEDDIQLQEKIAKLVRNRFEAGDISELTSSIAQVDTLKTKEKALRLSHDAIVLRHRLTALLGILSEDISLRLAPSSINPETDVPLDELLTTALTARPDLRAAELTIEAAGARIGWEKSRVFKFIAEIDGDESNDGSFDVGPGFEVEIPIFNRNEGEIAQAKAKWEHSVRQYEAVRQSIFLQVKESYTRYVAAHEEYELWQSSVVPSLQETARKTQESFAAGEVSYLLVLQAEQELIQARMHQAELAADLNRTAAQLNYSVGKKIL